MNPAIRQATQQKNQRTLHWLTCALPGLALVTRALWLARFPTDPIGAIDAEGFHLLAVNLLAGRGFAIGWEPPFCPTAIRPPLYPYFVIGVYTRLGAEPARVVLIQLLLEALTTALVIRLGREVGGRPAGALAGLLYALNGTTPRYTGQLLAEMLLLPLLAAALWVTLWGMRRTALWRLATAGTLWGAAILTKPNIQPGVWAIGALLTLRRLRASPRPGKSILAFWLLLGGLLLPWSWHNRRVLDRWIISTAFEENLARVSAVATLAEVQGVPVEPWTETWEYLYEQGVVARAARRYGWTQPWESYQLPCAVQTQRHQQIAEAAREIVSAHPWAYTRAHLRGVFASLIDPGHRLWYPALTGETWAATGTLDDVWARMAWSFERYAWLDAFQALWQERIARLSPTAALIWWGLVALRGTVWWYGARGAARLWRRRPWAALTLVGLTAYLLVLPGPIAHDRFYTPAIPAVAVLLALGAQKNKRSSNCRSVKRNLA